MENIYSTIDETQKWLWIELIGFDNTKKDYNVDTYLNNLGFNPVGISLLLYSIDFVNLHEGLRWEKKLAPCHCSYLAHPFNEDRARQEWTNFQLKGLIEEIKSYGIKVFLSFFNMFTYNDDDGNLVLEEFSKSHTELWDSSRDGTKSYYINMLKRLSSGEFYEDYFIKKTCECIRDYGFDGLQVADGISSGRKALQEADYSDDMVEQFLSYTNCELPQDIKISCEDDSVAFIKRAKYIWVNKRFDWIMFHVGRWEKYFKKLFDAVHSVDAMVLFHSAWTRDPFEAVYRFGIDYKKAAQAGADLFLVNEVSTGLAVLSKEDNGYLLDDSYRRKAHYEYTSMVMLIKAFSDNAKILTLAGIKDTTEDFDIIHHAPTSMCRSVYTNQNTYSYHNNKIEPCTSGPLFCLSDGLKKEEWDFINKVWQTGYTASLEHTDGITLVWSDERMYNELGYFIETRGWHTHKIVYELLYKGLPINSIVRVEDLSQVKGAILVTNMGLMPKNELEMVKNYNGGLQMFFGKPAEDEVQDKFSTAFSICSVPDNKELVSIKNTYNHEHLAEDLALVEDEHKGLWTCPLSYSRLNNEFLTDFVNRAYEFLKIPRIIKEAETCKIISIKLAKNKYRILVGNDDYYYNHPMIDMGKKIKSAVVVSKYYGYKAAIDGNTLCLKVPGRGMDIINVEIEGV